MERVTVRMARSDRNTSWGFGVTEAPNQDVIIVNVIGGSLADRAGLRNGDVIEQLEGLGNLDINAIDRLLVTSREKIELVVQRGAGGQARIWRPEITENPAMSRGGFSGHCPPVDERPYKVSLEHTPESRTPAGFNSSALPFNPDPRVKHLQYNSPMGLYSNENVVESYRQQTAGIVDQQPQGQSANNQPAYLRSETLRYLKEQERGNTLSDHPNPNGLPICFVCSRPILGVMAQAGGHTIHGDCLSCATCGNSLRNIGHHFIDNKFYCDIHGRQKKGLGPAGLDPNLAVRTPPTAAQPVNRPSGEGVRGSYQPEILTTRPVAVSPTPAPVRTQTTVHYSNPKTQGPISPSNRGVPTNVNYGGNASAGYTQTYGSLHGSGQGYGSGGAGGYGSGGPGGYGSGGAGSNRSVSPRPVIAAPAPPPPSNPPPTQDRQPPHVSTSNESRIPSSVRDAVSPRRSSRPTRQWPPPPSIPTNRFWQINPNEESKHNNEPKSLKEMIQNEPKRQPKLKIDTREPTREVVRLRPVHKTERPSISGGIHWTVITGPKSPEFDPDRKSQNWEQPAPPQPSPRSKIAPPVVPTVKKEEKMVKQTSLDEHKTPTRKAQADEESKRRMSAAPVLTRTSPPQAHQPPPPPANSVANTPTESQAPRTFQPKLLNQNMPSAPEAVTVIQVTDSQDPSAFQPINIARPRDLNSQSNLLVPQPMTIDSSTSPIPVITLDRHRLHCSSSPRPFVPHSPPYQRIPSPPRIRIETKSPPMSREENKTLLIGINLSPRPFGEIKKMKRVDFSETTIIPSPKWGADVVDESDIVSRNSVDSEDGQLKIGGAYDGDESEVMDGKSDTIDEYMEDEQERWMREELELAKEEEQEAERQRRWQAEREAAHSVTPTPEEQRPETPPVAASEPWEEAQYLEDEHRERPEVEEEEEENWSAEWKALRRASRDDAQIARDLAIVEAVNQRLQGLREMEEEDRNRAIEIIQRHQLSLEEQQDQLSQLLGSAINYLRKMAPKVDESQDTRTTPQQSLDDGDKCRPAFDVAPPRRQSSIDAVSRRQPSVDVDNVETASLTDALEELNTIRFETPADKISEQLRKKSSDNSGGDEQDQRFTRSTFERTSERHEQQNGGGGGIKTSTETRSHGALTNPTGRIPYCEACKQQIRGAFVLATGLAWCPEHFVCANSRCGRRLLECGFVEDNGKKYCEGCFETHIAPRCAKCAKPIVSDCLNALQKRWHPTCFTCAHCQKPFGNSAFYLENGQAYCEHDWNQLFTTKCVNCKFAIEAGDRWVEALGNAYHSNCFNCSRCHTNLEGESFFAKNGQPFCKMHA